jgi:hypothetical protein
MARYIQSQGDSYKVEFDTGGGGSYWAECLGDHKGPFNTKEDALRWVQNKLGGELPQSEDEAATAAALAEADAKEAEGTLGSDGARAAMEAQQAEDEEDIVAANEARLAREQTEQEIEARVQALMNEEGLTEGEARVRVQEERQGEAG